MSAVAVVTGASRGLGEGIARAFGGRGHTVYLSGRSPDDLEQVAREVEAAGGTGVAVTCDHRRDEEVKALFERVAAEAGRLDILVNNAAAVHAEDLMSTAPFWRNRLRLVDMIDVGLRSNYVATYHAAPILVATGGGLVAHISFYGAVSYFHGPAYGAAKAGTDKLAFDMAHDFRPFDVASVSIWPGFLRTHLIEKRHPDELPDDLRTLLPEFEHPDFTGLVLDALWRDPERMALSGETLIGADLGRRYGIRDLDGKEPRSFADTMGRPSGRFLTPA